MIGVVGGGQLAKMMIAAAKKRGIKICVQTPSKSDPAVNEANCVVFADASDINATSEMIKKCSCITFENEWIDIDKLSKADSGNTLFLPNLNSLLPLVDKISQRKILDEIGIPVFIVISITFDNSLLILLPTIDLE